MPENGVSFSSGMSDSFTWCLDGMEMDSHGGLEVTIRQTESKKKTTQQLRETDP